MAAAKPKHVEIEFIMDKWQITKKPKGVTVTWINVNSADEDDVEVFHFKDQIEINAEDTYAHQVRDTVSRLDINTSRKEDIYDE